MPEPNIPNDANTSLSDGGNIDGQTFDLDKIFGKEEGSESSTGVVEPDLLSTANKTAEDENQDLPALESDIFKGVTSLGRSSFKGQQDNMPKNPQEVIAKLQSERDKALSQVKQWETQATSWKTANDFLSELEGDRQVRLAFMAELEPELVKPKNPYDLIQETLKGEFKDFTPNPDEANVFGSKTWMYNQRAQDLLTEMKSKTAIPSSLKELRETRKAESIKQQQAALQEKQQIMADMTWDENAWGGFAKWMQSSKGKDFAKIYAHLLRQSGQSPKPLGTQRGSNFNSGASGAFNELNKFFGTHVN